jgi:hypothetical protein
MSNEMINLINMFVSRDEATSTDSKAIRSISMTIYLYVKTHNKTGLKYLGKTIKKDPHKYPGSGTYWRNHLKKHGHDYITVILKECQNEDELIFWGLNYSHLWNVIDSNEWANLKEEAGPHGKQSVETINKRIEKNKGQIMFFQMNDQYQA